MANTAQGTALESSGVPWWLVLIEGIVSILLAILMFWHPFGTFTALLVVLGIFWILEGIFGFAGIIAGSHVASKWWVGLLWALLLVLAGIAVLNQPSLTAYIALTFLVYTVAFMLIFSGLVTVLSANQLSKDP